MFYKKINLILVLLCASFISLVASELKRSLYDDEYRDFARQSDISLWIDEKQVREFFDTNMKIFAISDGTVLSYIQDAQLQSYLPVVPSEVISVNFTWKSGEIRQYFYSFDELSSNDTSILLNPKLTIARQGIIPREESMFRIMLKCAPNKSGIATLSLKLTIQSESAGILAGTPIVLNLKKHCVHETILSECDARCLNGGRCKDKNSCECRKGYMGSFCETPLCFPYCLNGGNCSAPGVCKCINGFIGPRCEGGICEEKCLNGGKCVQKDSCLCRRGYYGPRCEYSKCLIPCLNGGRCIGVNKCRCRRGFYGPQCESGSRDERADINKKQKKKFV